MCDSLAKFASCLLCLVSFSSAAYLGAAEDLAEEADQLYYQGSYAEAEESYRLLAEKDESQSALGIARCQIRVVSNHLLEDIFPIPVLPATEEKATQINAEGQDEALSA